MSPVWNEQLFEYDPERAALPLRDYQAELVAVLGDTLRLPPAGRKVRIEVATGGGKNFILNESLARHVLPDDRRVLWVTPNWELNEQAAGDLCQRHEGMRERISVLGAPPSFLFSGVARGASGQLVYTTIHTWNSRIRDGLADLVFDLIVIDEYHWGEGAPLYDRLLRHYGNQADCLGATATPRRWSSFERVGKSYDFQELVGRRVLARPIVVPPVDTNVAWTPETSGQHGDISAPSLRQLNRDDRNRLIATTYRDGQARYGKSIVFACDIAHAKALAVCFVDMGVRAAAIHSAMDRPSRAANLEAFIRGDLDVIVNVATLTHGIDIPSIQTVILARPTTSDILFAQMVGRGARRAPGKDHFFIIDCVDAVARHGVPIVRPAGFLGATALQSSVRGPTIERHVEEDSPLIILPEIPGYEDLAALEVHPRQTFGIEFEISASNGLPRTDRTTVAQAILDELRTAVPTAPAPMLSHGFSERDDRVWNIEPDPSCGWEVTTRILRGEDGIIEVVDACRALAKVAERLGLRVNKKTGTHIHLAWSKGLRRLQRLFDIVAYFEPALLSLVAPSRANNRFCGSVRRILREISAFATLDDWARHFRGGANRYFIVNPSNLFGGFGTIEVRLHSGTLSATKILTWLSLWMRLLSVAAASNPLPGDPLRRVRSRPLCAGPRGDVWDLCRYLGIGPTLTEKLLGRRDLVVCNSWCGHGTYGALARRLSARWNRTQARETPSAIAIPRSTTTQALTR